MVLFSNVKLFQNQYERVNSLLKYYHMVSPRIILEINSKISRALYEFKENYVNSIASR